MVAVGVVSWLSEQAMRGPGAATHAFGGIVASPTVAPQVVQRAVARVAQRRGSLPDLFERALQDIAATPVLGVQRGATLERAVGLDAQDRFARAARTRMAARRMPAQELFVRAEIADVVAEKDADAMLSGARVQRGN